MVKIKLKFIFFFIISLINNMLPKFEMQPQYISYLQNNVNECTCCMNIRNSDTSPEVQEVLDAIHHVNIEYLSLLETYTWNSIRKMMEVLSNCNCCERHQKNKPSVYDLENGHIGTYPSSGRDICSDDCNCRCRNEARSFCRIINNYNFFYVDEDEDVDEYTDVDEDVDEDTDVDTAADNISSSVFHDDCNQNLPEESENKCVECGEDMGPNNPRQLCGKTYCKNIMVYE